jgi:hypothetical protein
MGEPERKRKERWTEEKEKRGGLKKKKREVD